MPAIVLGVCRSVPSAEGDDLTSTGAAFTLVTLEDGCRGIAADFDRWVPCSWCCYDYSCNCLYDYLLLRLLVAGTTFRCCCRPLPRFIAGPATVAVPTVRYLLRCAILPACCRC